MVIRFYSKRVLLASATSIFFLCSPAVAADECGVAPPAGGSVTCTTAGNPYPNGIFYIAPADLTINLDSGVVVDTAGSLSPGILAIAGTLDAAIVVDGETNTSISTTDSGAFGALVATNNGDLTVALDEITTTGDNASGIFASSAEGTVTVSANDISTTGESADGINANTNSGDIFVDTGTITTAGLGANGIRANSDVADIDIVADSITTTGGPIGFINPGANGILATTGGAGTITIDAGTIATSGDSAIGIRATNNSGAIDITSDSVTTAGATADGISARSNGAVDVDAGIVTTSGDNANGIQVQSTTSATIGFDTVTTTGANSVGVLVPQGAVFFGPLFTPTVSITGGDVTTSGVGSDGIRAIASTGTVDLALTGTVSTTGDGSRGIVVSGPTGVTLTGNTNVSTTGVAANAVDVSSTTGPINLDFGTGAVSATGLGSLGINTTSTTGAQTITVNGVTADADAIQATSTDVGNIIINANNDVTSATGIGIDVATGGTAVINVAAGAPVTGNTLGINSVAAGGTVVNLRAPVVGTTGLEINLDGGSSTINNLAGGSFSGAFNLTDSDDLFNNSGTTTLTGTSDFGLGADAFNNQVGGTLNLTQTATVTGLETFNNRGLINAVGTTTFGGTAFNNLAGGTIDTSGSASILGVTSFNNAGSLDLAAGTFTVPAVVFTNSGTVFADEGASTITGQTSFANSGTIDLQDGAIGDVLTINSAFAGSGGSALLVDFNATTTDRLVINGAASGTTTVGATFLGGGFNLDGVQVVDATSSSANAFVLGAVTGETPLLDVSLIQTGADFFLVSAPTEAAFNPLVVPGFAMDLWYQSANEIFAETVKPASTVGISVWGNGYASRDRFGDDDDSVDIDGVDFDVDNELKTKRYGFQGGVDYGFGGGRVGLTGGYGWAKANGNADADLKAKGWNLGVYGQFGGLTGFHGEFLLKHDRYDAEFDDGAFDGQDFDIRSTGIDGSLGYRFGLGGAATVDLHAGLSHVKTKVDDINAFGFDYDLGRMTSTRGRAGVRAILGGSLAPYIDATVYREFNGDGEIELFDGGSTFDLDTNGRGTWVRLEAGLSGNNGPGPILAAWGDIGDRKAVGLRAGWRFGGRVAELAPPPPPPYIAPPAPPPPPPATQTCADGSVILATDMCPPPPPPPPPPPEPERG